METFVFPSAAENSTVDRMYCGHPGEDGWRVTPPCASENDTMNTSFSGGLISR
jgi:hypothetical protein